MKILAIDTSCDETLVFKGFNQDMKSQLLELNLNSLITKLFAIKQTVELKQKPKLKKEKPKEIGQIDLFS